MTVERPSLHFHSTLNQMKRARQILVARWLLLAKPVLRILPPTALHCSRWGSLFLLGFDIVGSQEDTPCEA